MRRAPRRAARYGIPFGGATVSLPDVVRALHDFLAANATKLNGDDDALLQGDGSPALERYREERAALARMDRLERERVLVRRDEVREGLGRIATIIREARVRHVCATPLTPVRPETQCSHSLDEKRRCRSGYAGAMIGTHDA